MKTRSGSRVLRFAVTSALLGGGSACSPKKGAKENEPVETVNEGPVNEPIEYVNEGPEPEPPPTLNEGPEPEPENEEKVERLPTANPGPERTNPGPETRGKGDTGTPEPLPTINPARSDADRPPPPRTNVGRVRKE